jgi:hypothetical protein
MSTAIAAATDTCVLDPDDGSVDDADGVDPSDDDPVRPEPDASLSADPRSEATCESTVLFCDPESSGAPAALADAVALPPSLAAAANDTDPTTLRFRCVVANV